MRVMTFNIQHCEDYLTQKIDYDAFAAVIKNSGADIIGLNEVRDEGRGDGYDAQAAFLAEKLGFHYYFAPAKQFYGGPYGNAILSRRPIESAEVVMIPDPEEKKYADYYETRCLLKAAIEAPCGKVSVCVTHFGLNPDEHENAIKTILKNIKSEKFILMGDFNVKSTDSALDPIREKLADTAEASSEVLLSWPSDKPDRKIDYIFTSADIKTKQAGVIDTMISDHKPYFADLEL